MIYLSRLSAMPLFFRDSGLWGGLLKPSFLLNEIQKHDKLSDLRVMTASHRWTIQKAPSIQCQTLSEDQLALVDIAQGILERGIWTAPSWRLEQYFASRTRQNLQLDVQQDLSSAGNLCYSYT
jgi:ATP-dependent DNA helicase RecQ